MADTIQFHSLLPGFKLSNKSTISSWIDNAIQEEGFKPGPISIVLCSDEYLLEVNRTYLKHDYYTDIISFDYTDNQIVSGDLLVSVDRVAENALEMGIDPYDELDRVFIHGVLHLCGYKDKTSKDQQVMRKRENHYLQKRNN